MKRATFGATLAVILIAIAGTPPARPATETARVPLWRLVAPDVVKDGRTGLSWTRADNGRDIAWAEAQAHCARKTGGWRLPGIAELAALYDGATPNPARCGTARCGVPAYFHLTGEWFWSATPVGVGESIDYDEESWGVLLVNGVRTQSLKDEDYGGRALCVQGP